MHNVHGKRRPRVVELQLECIGPLLAHLDLNECRKRDTNQIVGLGRFCANRELTLHLAHYVPGRILDARHRRVLLVFGELFRERGQADCQPQLDLARDLLDPQRVDSSAHDRGEVVMDLDVPAGDDPSDVHLGRRRLAARLAAGGDLRVLRPEQFRDAFVGAASCLHGHNLLPNVVENEKRELHGQSVLISSVFSTLRGTPRQMCSSPISADTLHLHQRNHGPGAGGELSPAG